MTIVPDLYIDVWTFIEEESEGPGSELMAIQLREILSDEQKFDLEMLIKILLVI